MVVPSTLQTTPVPRRGTSPPDLRRGAQRASNLQLCITMSMEFPALISPKLLKIERQRFSLRLPLDRRRSACSKHARSSRSLTALGCYAPVERFLRATFPFTPDKEMTGPPEPTLALKLDRSHSESDVVGKSVSTFPLMPLAWISALRSPAN